MKNFGDMNKVEVIDCAIKHITTISTDPKYSFNWINIHNNHYIEDRGTVSMCGAGAVMALELNHPYDKFGLFSDYDEQIADRLNFISSESQAPYGVPPQTWEESIDNLNIVRSELIKTHNYDFD